MGSGQKTLFNSQKQRRVSIRQAIFSKIHYSSIRSSINSSINRRRSTAVSTNTLFDGMFKKSCSKYAIKHGIILWIKFIISICLFLKLFLKHFNLQINASNYISFMFQDLEDLQSIYSSRTSLCSNASGRRDSNVVKNSAFYKILWRKVALEIVRDNKCNVSKVPIHKTE